MIEIVEVTSRQQYRAFFQFPFELYRNCAQWVPPIAKEEMDIFDPQKNAVFEHAMARLFLAKKKGKVVGRIAAMINWVEIEETPQGLASASVLSYLRKTDDPFYARRFVKRLSQVNIQEVKRVAEKYLLTFFNPNQTHTAIVCGPGDVDGIKELFMEFDPPFQIEEITNLENSILTYEN